MLKDILDRKKAFLDCENKKLKKSNILHFPKGVSPSFSRKFEKFPCFYFSQNQPEKCAGEYLERRKAFLDYKKKS